MGMVSNWVKVSRPLMRHRLARVHGGNVIINCNMILTSPSGCEEPWFLGSFVQPCVQPAYQVIIITEISASALTKSAPTFTERGMGELTELGDLLAKVMGSRLDEPPGSQGSLNSLDMQRKMGTVSASFSFFKCFLLFHHWEVYWTHQRTAQQNQD